MKDDAERRATKMSSENKEAAAPKRVESDVYDRQIRLWGADAQVRTTFSCDLLGFLFRSAAAPSFLLAGTFLLAGSGGLHVSF